MHTMSIISTCSILKICSCWGKCFYSGRSFCFNRSSGVNRSFGIRQNILHLIRQELRIRQKRQIAASLDHWFNPESFNLVNCSPCSTSR